VQGLVAFQYKQSDSAGGLYSVTNIAEKEDDFTAHRRAYTKIRSLVICGN
jgi:hypothetical protein